jgi:hypothetical protein
MGLIYERRNNPPQKQREAQVIMPRDMPKVKQEKIIRANLKLPRGGICVINNNRM